MALRVPRPYGTLGKPFALLTPGAQDRIDDQNTAPVHVSEKHSLPAEIARYGFSDSDELDLSDPPSGASSLTGVAATQSHRSPLSSSSSQHIQRLLRPVQLETIEPSLLSQTTDDARLSFKMQIPPADTLQILPGRNASGEIPSCVISHRTALHHAPFVPARNFQNVAEASERKLHIKSTRAPRREPFDELRPAGGREVSQALSYPTPSGSSVHAPPLPRFPPFSALPSGGRKTETKWTTENTGSKGQLDEFSDPRFLCPRERLTGSIAVSGEKQVEHNQEFSSAVSSTAVPTKDASLLYEASRELKLSRMTVHALPSAAFKNSALGRFGISTDGTFFWFPERSHGAGVSQPPRSFLPQNSDIESVFINTWDGEIVLETRDAGTVQPRVWDSYREVAPAYTKVVRKAYALLDIVRGMTIRISVTGPAVGQDAWEAESVYPTSMLPYILNTEHTSAVATPNKLRWFFYTRFTETTLFEAPLWHDVFLLQSVEGPVRLVSSTAPHLFWEGVSVEMLWSLVRANSGVTWFCENLVERWTGVTRMERVSGVFHRFVKWLLFTRQALAVAQAAEAELEVSVADASRRKLTHTLLVGPNDVTEDWRTPATCSTFLRHVVTKELGRRLPVRASVHHLQKKF